MKSLILTLALLVSITAKAGHEVGNGGTIIKCEDGRVELTDLFEARVFRGLQSALGDPTEDFKIKIERVFTALARVAPYRTQKYRQLYSEFFNDAVFVTGVDLTPIADVDPKGLPAGCGLKQAVIQTVPQFIGDKRYTIDQDKWNEMNENSKAGLVLHEIIYNEALHNGEDKSITTRYITGYVTSTALLAVTQEKFNEILLSARFKMVDQFGSLVYVNKEGSKVGYAAASYNDFFDSVETPALTEILGVRLGAFFTAEISSDEQTFSDVQGINRPNLKVQIDKGEVSKENSSYVVSKEQSTFAMGDQLHGISISVSIGNAEISLTNELNGAVVSSTTVAGMAINSEGKPLYGAGVIQVKIPKMNYVSPVLASFSGQIPFYASGIPMHGSLVENVVKLNSPQGAFYFTPNSTYATGILTEFDESGLVKESNIVAGQRVRTAKGIVITKPDNRVKFLADGLAEITDTSPTPSPTEGF